MNVLEILNAYPGETFIREHGKAIVQHTDIALSWAYTQTGQTGSLPHPFEGLKHCIALPNFNRLPRWRKAAYRLLSPTLPVDRLKERGVLQAIAKTQPDWLHFQFAGTAVQWAWLAIVLQVPFSFSLRGSDVQVAPHTLAGYSEKLRVIGEQATAIHAVCEDLKRQFIALTLLQADKIKVIRTTIDPAWSLIERQPESGLIIAVGRLHWAKGYPDLLLACHELKARGGTFRLVIIGEGPERPRLEYIIRDLGLTDRVILAGQQSHADIWAYFSKAHLFVLSSIAEGFPNVVGEAMVAGVPVVVADCGGVSEVIEDGINGYLFPSGSPNQLAQRLLIALGADTTPLIKNAKHKANQYFSPKVHAESFQSFWQAPVETVCSKDSAKPTVL